MKTFLTWYGLFLLAVALLAAIAQLGAQSLLFIGFGLGWFANQRYTVKKKPKRKKKQKA